MRSYRLEIVLGLALAALLAVAWHWLAPGNSARLSSAEVDAYVRQIAQRMPTADPETAEVLARLRAWGEADDGAPVYMLNLMRYFDQIKRIPGAEAIQGTPAAANLHYEAKVRPLLVRAGGVPLFAGQPTGLAGGDGARHSNLFAFEREVDDWSRVLLVRYPSRRAFFDLIRDPAYWDIAPYKLASLKLALVPLKAELVLPDPRWILATLGVTLFLAVGWVRAARRR